MALATGTVWEFNASATASMVNGGGFNTANASFPTDLTTDANTANTNSPVVSSASYNFAAGDASAWVYVKSGTNWTAGWYQIASVASNKATLSAAAGQAIQVNATTGAYQTNTAAGCATVGTPTGGTFGVDYSQTTSSITNAADLAGANANTATPTVTSAGKPFGVNHTGNIIHVNSGTNWTAGWFEVVSVSGTTATLDRACASVASPTSGTFHVGGALSLNSTLDSGFLGSTLPAGGKAWFKNGSFTAGQALAGSSGNGTNANPVLLIGYNSTRGDNPTGTNRPTVAMGANALTFATNQHPLNMIFTGSAATLAASTLATNTSHIIVNCKFLNTSSTTARVAFGSSGSANTAPRAYQSEFVSQNGIAFSAAPVYAVGCYFHDSDKGFSASTNGTTVLINCLFEGNVTADLINTVSGASAASLVGNTFYGSEAQVGIGVDFTLGTTANGQLNPFANNVFYGKATALSLNTADGMADFGVSNTFFNNGATGSNYSLTVRDLLLNPQFTGASQLTGSTATTSGSVLTDSGANFSGINDNVDFLHVTSGTGVTTGCYLITSHTSTTLTVNNALGTSSGGDVVYWVTNGHNFQIGTNLKAQGVPGYLNAVTTSYQDVGAAQRSESANTNPVGFPRIIQNIGTY